MILIVILAIRLYLQDITEAYTGSASLVAVNHRIRSHLVVLLRRSFPARRAPVPTTSDAQHLMT